MKAALAGVTLALVAALAGCGTSGGASPDGALPGSTTELKTASDRTPEDKRAEIRLQLAIGYYQQGAYEVALDEIKQALLAKPTLADAYGVRALIYAAMNEQALAEENFQRAIHLAPRNPELNNNYGFFLCNIGRETQGLAQLETALKNPQYQSPVLALVNGGTCALKVKNYELAERYLLDAVRYEPDLPAIQSGLARLYYERRDYERAAFFIDRLKAVQKPETMSADILWLAIRVERRKGDKAAETQLATQLRRRHPGSPEYAAFQRGAFNE